MKVKNFDLHIVANYLPSRLAEQLFHLGYLPQRVVGGDPRVRMHDLLSLKVDDKATADRLYTRSVSAIKGHPEFTGYIEEEAILEDLAIHGADLGRLIDDFPEKLQVNLCPPDRYKKCDIHVTTCRVNCQSVRKLLEAGFYFLSLDKKDLGVAQVCTIQLEDLARGRQMWSTTLDYLRESGAFEGYAKFEATIRIESFGFVLPPIVLNESPF